MDTSIYDYSDVGAREHQQTLGRGNDLFSLFPIFFITLVRKYGVARDPSQSSLIHTQISNM